MALYHLKKGSVNYTVVGAPTIVDGVVSGFSRTDYLTLPAPTGTISSFEFVADFTTGSKYASDDAGEFDCIIGQQTNRGTPQIEVAALSNGHVLQFLAAASGSKVWDVDIKTSVVAQLNTRYLVKFVWDGTNTYCYYKNNKEWVLLGTQPLSSLKWDSKIRIGTDDATKNFLRGSINLNNTYIKVNGQPWFGKCPIEVQQHQVRGPVGYAVVGSPAITDGVAGGFTSGNYLQISSILDTAKNWEFVCKFSNTTSRYKSVIVGSTSPYSLQVSVSYGTRLFIFMSSNGTSWNLRNGAYGPSNSLVLGNEYYLKIVYSTDSGYKFYLSADGKVWSENYSFGDKQALYNTDTYLTLGHDASNEHLGGSINLNETYIKENGKLWFWQPQETKRIVVNGVEVWRKAQ